MSGNPHRFDPSPKFGERRTPPRSPEQVATEMAEGIYRRFGWKDDAFPQWLERCLREIIAEGADAEGPAELGYGPDGYLYECLADPDCKRWNCPTCQHHNYSSGWACSGCGFQLDMDRVRDALDARLATVLRNREPPGPPSPPGGKWPVKVG